MWGVPGVQRAATPVIVKVIRSLGPVLSFQDCEPARPHTTLRAADRRPYILILFNNYSRIFSGNPSNVVAIGIPTGPDP